MFHTRSISRLVHPLLALICILFSFDLAVSAENSARSDAQGDVPKSILADEERAWIEAHPEIRVANETDWPPFDFTEGSQPRGYSMDLIRLVGENTGLNIRFVNGFSWEELLTKFKNGDIDVMPAIFKTPERTEWIAFTRPYSENPTVLVVEKNNTEVTSLKSLFGKKIAVIPGYSLTEVMEKNFPEILRVEVQDVTDALLAVSSGEVDGFIESLGPVSHISQNKHITNIRIVGEVLKDIRDEQKLHMAVLKDNPILLGIIQKGLDAITDEQAQQLHRRWFQLGLTETEGAPRAFWGILAETFVYVPPIILSLFFIAYLFLFKRLRLNKLLTFTFVIITSVAVTVIASISFQTAKRSLELESFNKLTAVREIKEQQLKAYFETVRNQVLTFSENQMTIEAMRGFARGFNEIGRQLNYSPRLMERYYLRLDAYYRNEFLPRLNANLDEEMGTEEFFPDSETALILQDLYIGDNQYRTGHKLNLDHAGDKSYYSTVHQKFHPIIRNYLLRFGYYDIFLVEPETGHIVYSVFKEVDFGTSLLDGPYKDANIARAFRKANEAESPDAVMIFDFEPYYPSYHAPAAFIASPIFDEGEKTGVLIFQMPVEKINEIMTNQFSWSDVGLGDSGETYVVGPDFNLRNQSRFFIEDRASYFRLIEEVGIPAALIEKIKNLDTTIGLQPIRTLGTKDAMAGNSGTRIFPDYRGVEVLSSYKPLGLEGLQWVIMSEIDKQEAFAHVYFLRNVVFYCYVVMLLIIVVTVYYFSNHITRPLVKLTDYANELARHDFSSRRSSSMAQEVSSVSTSANEVGILAKTFLFMEQELEGSVRDLMQTTAAKERMESELNIGKEIQMHMLPSRFPEQDEIDVFGTLMAAREVGGDWYDFFFIDDDHFCFGVGDVSGKGVPAALFMAVSQTLIKASVPLEGSTARVISLLNTELAADNPNFMFATIFLCVLNIRTGQLLFTNAAHNPAYLLGEDGALRPIDSRHGLVVGPLRDSAYQEETIALSAGETVVLYTDGVTEAMDPEENLFSDERLAGLLAAMGNQAPVEIVQSVIAAVKEFEAGGEQADDITLLAVRFNGPSKDRADTFRQAIGGDLAEISSLCTGFEEFARRWGIDEQDIPKYHIIFEELLSNIINYGTAGRQDLSITVTVERRDDHVAATIVDNGIAFNPLAEITAPDTDLPLEDRPIGGLGFHIVQNLVDSVDYERRGGENILSFSRKT